MRILGIDPGTARVGYGVIDVPKRGALHFVECGLIATQPTTAPQDRLLEISQDLESIIQKTQPTLLSIEKLFFQTNVKTALRVGESRGIILLAAARHHLPVVEMTPLQVKQSLTGYGKAEKSQVEQMVIKILKLSFTPTPDDVADALAIAIAGASYQSTSFA